MTWDDPIVAEVRATRERIMAEFDYDLAAYMEHIRRREEHLRREGWVFVEAPSRPADRPPAADRGAA
jgi:hypothetical protein